MQISLLAFLCAGLEPRATTVGLAAPVPDLAIQEAVRHRQEPGHDTPRRVLVHEVEGEEGEEGEAESEETPAVAVVLFGAIILVPIFVEYLHSANPVMQLISFRLLEYIITIFIAVIWFSTFDGLLQIGGFAGHHAILAAVVHLVLLLAVVAALQWSFKETKTPLTVLTACGAHFIGFSAAHTVGHVHITHFEEVWLGIPFVAAVALGVVVVCGGMHHVRTTAGLRGKEYEEASNDMENDAMALAVGYAMAQAAKFALSGSAQHFEHTHEAKEFLQREGEEEEHTGMSRALMFLFAFLVMGLSILVPEVEGRWYASKAADIGKTALVMAGAFGMLLALDWQYEEAWKPEGGSETFAAAVFALIVTSLAFFTIFIMAQFPLRKSVLTAVPLVVGLSCAFAWEECFDKAMDVLADHYSVGGSHYGTKVMLAVVAPLALVPSYVRRVKPRIIELTEEQVK